MKKDEFAMKWPSLTAKNGKLCIYKEKTLVELTPRVQREAREGEFE